MKHTIWSNHINLDEWEDYFEENPDYSSDDERYEAVGNLLNDYYEDELMNLDKKLGGKIIAIADVGLWNGRAVGYKILDNNLNNVLHIFEDCEYIDIYCDRYNVKSSQAHHDGTHYIVYRQFRDGLTDEQIEHFTDKLYYGTVTDRDIRRYTISLVKAVRDVYGF